MRMNDIHCGEEPDSPLHCAFWREHPELRISDTAYENSFDFSHKSAREFILNRVFELIDKYDFDGLSLDWTRFPTFFPHGQGEKKLGLITEIIEAAREKIDHKSNSEKRKIGFGVRVPGLISVCRQRGLDAIEWSNRGLIDYIVIAPFLMTTDFDLPVEDWRKNTPKDFPVVCGVESTVCAYPGAPRTRMTPDEFRGAAGAMFCRGSRAVYLFNCFEYLQKDYPGMFKELGGIETIKGKSRAFRVTWHDNLMTIGEQDRMNRLPGEGDKWREFKTLNGTYPFELPAIIKPGGAKSFKIHTAFKPEKDARTLIEIKSSPANALHLTVTVNEISGVEFASYEDDVLFFKIQPDVLTDGFTIVKVQNNSGADVKLLDIRIKIDFTG
jgi:hypothetical protein